MRRPCVLAGLVAGVAAQGAVVAQVIDFETTPSGATPVDNQPLDRTEPYIVGGVAVTIGFDTDGDGITDTNALFERRGVDGSDGFQSFQAPIGYDTERDGSPRHLGDFFLRQATGIGPWPGPMIIEYDANVDALSGEIWDLDSDDFGRTERWRISAFDEAGALLRFVDSPPSIPQSNPASLDSLAWEFSIVEPGQIRRVEIDFIGTKTTGIGLAFNNFSPTAATVLSIDQQPQSVLLAHPGGMAELSVLAAGAGTLQYQWRRDGVDLVDGGAISGARSDRLFVDARAEHVGVYDVVVRNDFGQVLSDPAVLAIRPPACPADFDGNGVLDFFDFLAFQEAFAAGCP
jgi:hypothetical protein